MPIRLPIIISGRIQSSQVGRGWWSRPDDQKVMEGEKFGDCKSGSSYRRTKLVRAEP